MAREEEIPYTQDEIKAMVKTIEQLRKEKEELIDKACEWLNKHHFDYRGLIENNLAIEATEENNQYKE